MKHANNWVKGFFPKTESIRGEHYFLVTTLLLMTVFMVAYKVAG